MNIGNENYYNHTHTMNFKSILQLLTIYVIIKIMYVHCMYVYTYVQYINQLTICHKLSTYCDITG